MSSFLPQFLVGLTAGISVLSFGLVAAGTWPTHTAWLSALALLLACLWLRWTGHAGLSAPAAANHRLMQSSELASADVLNQLRDDFLATLSHELRTPLNAMLGWVRLLRLQAPVDPTRALDAIERNAAHQAHLIDELLDVSHMLKGGLVLSPMPMRLDEAARAAVDEMEPAARQKHVTLVLRAEREAAIVDGDFARLRQAIRNLLSNAIKFTPSGGRIDVHVACAGSEAEVEVRDSGHGVDASFLPHMFEPFKQGPSREVRAGLGLGLSIVEAIVAEHGGEVTAHSDGWGRGTVMRVRLPLARTPSSDRSAVVSRPVIPPALEDRVVRNTGRAGEAATGRPGRESSVEDRVEEVRPAVDRPRADDPVADPPVADPLAEEGGPLPGRRGSSQAPQPSNRLTRSER